MSRQVRRTTLAHMQIIRVYSLLVLLGDPVSRILPVYHARHLFPPQRNLGQGKPRAGIRKGDVGSECGAPVSFSSQQRNTPVVPGWSGAAIGEDKAGSR